MTEREHYRVLLVEDNELDARSLVRSLTTDAGCTVERVADLASGLDAVRCDAYDCVLLDLSLPDSDGLISVDSMVARSPNCPVVVLTGLDDPEVALEAVARGAQDYLVKNTMNPELVTRAIRYAVARHHAEAELVDVQARLDSMHAREQIARDLHDTVIQRLFATGMTLQAATSLETREEVAERARAAVGEIDDAIRELRQAIFGLNLIDDDESFARELGQITESYRESLGFSPVVRIGELAAIPSELRQDVLAIAREALSNVVRHANASAVTLTVVVDKDRLLIRVTDNGEGISEDDIDRAGLSGNGLINMRSRAGAHGGTMELESGPTGTELRWTVPL